MSDRNKNIKESLSEFIRYKQGKMSGEEKNSFERELQKDPFAEEAADGYDSIPADAVSEDLSFLQKQIRSRITTRRRYIYYGIAATVAVLMVISTLVIVINRRDTPQQIAILTTTEKSSSKKEEPTPPVLAEEIKPEEKEAVRDNIKSKEAKKPVIAADKMQGAGAAVQKQDEVPPISDPVAEIKLNTINAAIAEMQAAAPMASRAVAKAEIIADSDLYSLNEVVVVGYGAKEADSEEYNTPSGYTPPQPVYGKSAFNKYIEENITRPDTVTAGQRIVVVINFTVLLDGSIDSIKIAKSPGKPFSDEAIRLIKSGPKWKPAEVDGQAIADEVKIRIIFR